MSDLETPAMAMEIVAKNLEHGNQMVLERLSRTPGAGSA